MGRFGELRDALAQTARFGVGTPACGLREAALDLRAHGFADSADAYLREALDWYGRQSEAERDRLRRPSLIRCTLPGGPTPRGSCTGRSWPRRPSPWTTRSRARVQTLRGRLGTIAAGAAAAAGTPGLGDPESHAETAQRMDARLRRIRSPQLRPHR